MNASSARTDGTLYIVATPIGNREDISMRALAVLQAVDTILAEDTRHTKHLLSTYGIQKPMLSLHAHNEGLKAESIVRALEEGQSFALVSDAGTPLMSDPGYPLVHLARQKGLMITPIPGACAFVAALSAAGVPCDTFSFFGFLPAKRVARTAKLASLRTIPHTLIFYESTHRIEDTLHDMRDVFGEDSPLVLVKELTKTFERFVSGNVAEVIAWLAADPAHTKGEFVLIRPPVSIATNTNDEIKVLSLLLAELPVKQAVKLAVEITGQPKNELYKIALSLDKT